VRAAEVVSPVVVAVHVLRTEQVRVSDPFWDSFSFFGPSFGTTQARRVPSLGSGFVIDPSGVILTNDHVVRGAEEILVTFPDGRDMPAVLVGSDEASDVAVLRIEAEGLLAARIGSTSDLRIGEWVIAFGNPFGNLLSNPEPTVTVGVVSAIGRHIVPAQDEGGFYLGMIQTDAAINPGNSGGPLVNASGQVIGMNTSIFSRSGGSEGMGFAIPIERALGIANDILEHGQVRRAWVGLYVEPEEADAFGRTRGVRVAQVVPDSPGARAGIRAGDRLVEVNGRRLVTPLDFDAALLDLRTGDPVTLAVEGRSSPVRLVSAALPSLGAERVRLFDGLDLVTLTPAIRAERRISSEWGALVVGITSAQIQSVTGLREGDLIVGVGRQAIRGAEELSALLDQVPARSRVQFVFERNGGLALSQEFILGD
jgi:serine protease Do